MLVCLFSLYLIISLTISSYPPSAPDLHLITLRPHQLTDAQESQSSISLLHPIRFKSCLICRDGVNYRFGWSSNLSSPTPPSTITVATTTVIDGSVSLASDKLNHHTHLSTIDSSTNRSGASWFHGSNWFDGSSSNCDFNHIHSHSNEITTDHEWAVIPTGATLFTRHLCTDCK